MSDRDTKNRAAKPGEKKGSDIRNMRDAVEVFDKRKIYGDSPAQQENPPQKKAPKRLKRKMRTSLFERIFSPESGEKGRGFRLFGRSVSFWPVLIGAVAVFIVGILFLDSRNLTTYQQMVSIVGLPADLENYKILKLSDLNGKRFGDKQSTLLRLIDTLDYDVVLITGDMVGASGDAAPFYELLEGLPSRKKVYFISGDSDPGPYVDKARGESGILKELVLADWILGAIERGAVYVDSPVQITVGASNIWLTPASMLNLDAADTASVWKEQTEQEQAGVINGISADYATLPFTTYRYDLAQKLLSAATQITQTDLHISLAHIPPTDEFITAIETAISENRKSLTRPDLILAGHYCGGVWRTPLGAFYIPSSIAGRHGWFPAKEDVAGLSGIGETQMYISSGLSTCSEVPIMAMRFLNRPQITVLTLTATLPESMLGE